MDMDQQEYLMKLQLLDQQANQFGEQLKIIDQQIEELLFLKENMLNLEETKEKEIYAEIGKGIFMKAQIDKKELLVDVGNKVFVPKTFKDINELVDSQVIKFDHVKNEISNRINEINLELDSIVNQVNTNIKEKDNKSSKKVEKKKKI